MSHCNPLIHLRTTARQIKMRWANSTDLAQILVGYHGKLETKFEINHPNHIHILEVMSFRIST